MKKIVVVITLSVILVIFLVNMNNVDEIHLTPFGVVGATIEYDPIRCSAEYPMLVSFNNGSIRSLSSITFSWRARYSNRSTNLIASGSLYYLGSSEWNIGGVSDRIVEPFNNAALCYKMPRLVDISVGHEELVWEIRIDNVNWK